MVLAPAEVVDVQALEAEEPMAEEELEAGEDLLENEGFLEAVEDAVLDLVDGGLTQAIGLSQDVKRRWSLFLRMKQGLPPEEWEDDPLIDLDVYLPDLAKFTDTLRSQYLNDLIDDPSMMDFFEIDSPAQGVWPYTEAVSSLLQHKFKEMKPRNCTGYMDFLSRSFDDLLTLGNMTSIATHEVLEGDDGDMVRQGPTMQWVDPFNVWPWRTDVHTLDETDVTVYDPLSEWELTIGDYQNVEEALEIETTGPGGMRDENASADSEEDGGGQQHESLKHRYVSFLKWPIFRLVRALEADYPEVTSEDVVLALATKYEFDLESVRAGGWWDIQHIGETLIRCKPYPLLLPVDRSPLMLHGLNKRNGQLWSLGLYDRGAWDERLKNLFHRHLITLSAFNSRPPIAVYHDMIEPEYLQVRGEDFRLEPGDTIPLVTSPGSSRFFEEAHYNAAGMQWTRSMAEYH